MFDSLIYATVRWPLHSKLFRMAAWLSAYFISSATVFTWFNLLWSNIHGVWKGRALPLLDIPCSGVLPSCLVVWPLFHNANDKLLEVWGKLVDDPKIESRYTDEISIGQNWNWIWNNFKQTPGDWNLHSKTKLIFNCQNISASNGVFPSEISPFRNNKFHFQWI